jgi:hypothetical protein
MVSSSKSSSSSGTDVISVRVDESMVSKGVNGRPKWWGLTTDILTKVMHIQWMIIAPLLAYVTMRMSYSSDENWVAFIWSVVVVLLLFLPILLICPCCTCCLCGVKGVGEQLLKRNRCP